MNRQISLKYPDIIKTIINISRVIVKMLENRFLYDMVNICVMVKLDAFTLTDTDNDLISVDKKAK